MLNRTVLVIFLVCSVLFCISVWYLLKQKQQDINQVTSLTNAMSADSPILQIQAVKETANIERQIQQVKVNTNPPEILRLNELLSEFEEDPTKWDIVIAVADIYRRGAFPRFLPNEEIALRCYKVAAMCPNGKVAGIGQSKYIEARDEPIDNIDKAGNKLPTDVGITICEIAESTIQSTPWHLFEKPNISKAKTPKEPVALINTDFDMYDDLAWMTQRHEAENIPNNITLAYRIDSQNVHDHGVSTITKHNIESLSKTIDINKLGSSDNTIENIKKEILDVKDIDGKIKEEALHVIDKLGDNKHSGFDVSEKEALKMVWDKIQKTDDSTIRENLKETLAKQLACSIEHGHVVCSSGKITRIMGTLDGVSNVPTRPTWALRDEIGNLASKLRNQYTTELGDTPEAGRRMREEFDKQVRLEYINKLGMSSKIIDPLISEYESGF